jgi:hypothetical protein
MALGGPKKRWETLATMNLSDTYHLGMVKIGDGGGSHIG